mgnify:CR=1 FL=1
MLNDCKVDWGSLCGSQTPKGIKYAADGKRAWGFTRISLERLIEMCRRCKGKVTMSSPYLYIDPPKQDMFPTCEGDSDDDDDDFPEVRKSRAYELNPYVRRRMRDRLNDAQIEKARLVFSQFDYVPQTKITFRANSPYGSKKPFVLIVRIVGARIQNETFVGLSHLSCVRACMISLAGTTAVFRITVRADRG